MTGPNLLVIHCHDLGRHLGCHGVGGVPTPRLDAFAAEAVRCDRAFATAPLCSPSRGSLWTGRHPHSNGLMGLAHTGWEYHSEEQTLPELLRPAGYRSALIGLQHESSDPTTLGYDEVQQVVGDEQWCAPIAELAAVWLRQESGRRRDGETTPFALTVGLFEPHRPWPAELYPPVPPESVQVPSELPDTPEVRADLAGFVAAIGAMDAAVGVVLDALTAAGLDTETVVLFTTDHGIAFPGAKSTLHDAGIEVTQLWRIPGVAAHATEALISHLDVLPTMLDLAGVEIPSRVQGVSQLGVLRGETEAARSELHAEKNYHDPDQYDPVRCLRTTTHKLIRSFEPRPELLLPGDIRAGSAAESVAAATTRMRAEVELYDLLADPDEQHNLAADPDHAELLTELSEKLLTWQVDTADPVLAGLIPKPRNPGRLRRSWRRGVG